MTTTSSPPVATSSSQSADVILNNVTTMTSLLHDVGLTVAPSGDSKTEGGCFVVDSKLNPEDNAENIITKEARFWITTIIAGVVVPLLFLLGVPGNILSAAVFYRQGLRERINLCVFCLALVDLVALTVLFFLSAEEIYRLFFGSSSFFIRYFVGLTGFTWVSMFLSAVIAAERCFCVVSPLRAQRILSTRAMAAIVFSMSLVILGGMLFLGLTNHTEVCVFDPSTNVTSYIVYVTEFYIKNQEIFDIFDIFVYATVLPFTFVTIVVITTIITAAKLRSAVKWRQQTSSAATGSCEDHMLTLTRMLIATSVLFVVCLSPILMVQLSIFIVPDLSSGNKYHNLWSCLWKFIDVFRCLNSSLNFFVYYNMGSRFRQILKRLLACQRQKDICVKPHFSETDPVQDTIT
ncbi:uncharacterized protein LOC143281364 [Babylonia areolata]|uniref:uncharacterized protein LOC143281364 n=1 Tax=Babylonia areolata TaxID=304850 RepID=UPI003FD6913B